MTILCSESSRPDHIEDVDVHTKWFTHPYTYENTHMIHKDIHPYIDLAKYN